MGNKKNKSKKRRKQQKLNIERKKINSEIKIDNENFQEKINIRDTNLENNTEKTDDIKIQTDDINLQIDEINNINVEKNIEIENSKEENSNKKNKFKNKIIICLIITICLSVLFGLSYIIFRPKFKDLTIELGKTDIDISDFLVSKIYYKWANIVTDLNTIDLNKVQENDITLKFLNKEQVVKLKIVDTTAPKIKLKEITRYLDYQLNPDDFIEEKSDLSEMTVEIVNDVNITDYGEYSVKIKVKDCYGNETVGDTNLIITWLLSDVDLELGSEFSVQNIVVDADRFGNLVPQTEIDKVDTMKLRRI